MKVSEQLASDIKSAMLSKDKVRLSALRAIKSAFLLEATKEGGNGQVSDDVGKQLVVKLHKQRMDAYNIYVEQSRSDLAQEELQQAKVLEEYLPKQLTEKEVVQHLELIITKVGANGMSDMGKVMGMAMGKLKGKADGKMISTLVKKLLSKFYYGFFGSFYREICIRSFSV